MQHERTHAYAMFTRDALARYRYELDTTRMAHARLLEIADTPMPDFGDYRLPSIPVIRFDLETKQTEHGWCVTMTGNQNTHHCTVSRAA